MFIEKVNLAIYKHKFAEFLCILSQHGWNIFIYDFGTGYFGSVPDRIPDLGYQTHIFESLMTSFGVESFEIL
jgi:hypothetical protein